MDLPGKTQLHALLSVCLTESRADLLTDALVRRFGSVPALIEVCSAHQPDLSIPQTACTLLGMIPGLCQRRIYDRLGPRPILNTLSRAGEYAQAMYIGTHHESFRLLCLDEELRLMAVCQLEEGSLKEISFQPRRLIERALESRSRAIILCHNHPSGRPHFSEADSSSTRELLSMFAAVDIALIDHLLVAHERVVSLRLKDYFPDRLWMNSGSLMPTRAQWKNG